MSQEIQLNIISYKAILEDADPAKQDVCLRVSKSFIPIDKDNLNDDPELINQLIDQVYQFSRMYWKSTNQQSLPFTIKYPEMVVEIYPYFQHEKLSPFGQESLSSL